MSAILDQSLDEIVSANKKNNQRNRRASHRSAGAANKAPAGGIQKNSKPAKQQPQQQQQQQQQQQKTKGKAQQQQKATKAASKSDSKVIVRNLPKDVSEQQIKEYFNQTVGPIKQVIIAYGPNSQSRGIAEVIFSRADGATKAASLNGLLVDGRPIKIEIVVSSDQATQVLPAPKSLADRATLPKNLKNQPKSAANEKKQEKKVKSNNHQPAQNNQKNNQTGSKKQSRRRSSRPAKKTAEELDAEMAEYYNLAPTAAAPAAAAPEAAAASTDVAMDDNIM